jgi:IS30 family transposase
MYRAVLAEKRARRRRRKQGRKRLLNKYPKLKHVILAKLKLHWSPEQIAVYLKMTYADTTMHVSHETIYASIYVLPKGVLKKSLVQSLRQKRKYRYRTGSKATRTYRNLPNLVSIDDRPKGVENRTVAGHWEGDLILGKWKRSALGTLVERKTRYLKLVPLGTHKDHESVRKGIAARLNRLPAHLKQSLTWDRGTEMSSHETLTKRTKIKVYFAHPASPWERGTNENTNMLVRDFFPKKTDFTTVSRKQILYVEKIINERPRKSLGWRTPKEALETELLR